MPVFKILGEKVKKFGAVSAGKEKNIQNLVENNLEEIFGIKFIKSEFETTHGGRIDTLGLDKNNSPVIIEFKEREDENIINQGLFYLFWILDHKREFEKLAEDKGMSIKTIDWSEPRLICIAQEYNRYDPFASKLMNELMNISIELQEYHLHEDNTIVFNNCPLPDINLYLGKSNKQKIDKDIKATLPPLKYDLTHHFKNKNATKETINIFQELRQRILNLGPEVKERITKNQIGYKSNIVFCSVYIQKSGIRVFIEKDKDSFSDPKKITHEIKWDPPTNFLIKSFDEIEYAMLLIKQAYNCVK